MLTKNSSRWMQMAVALSERGRARTSPNPNVGCVLVKDARVVGRGWTQPGGRPHAEAMALAEAGEAAKGATAWVTLEPCAHQSARGPSCADSLIAAGVARVVAALEDPDPRTAGAGVARLRAAGIDVAAGEGGAVTSLAMAGWLTRLRLGRPFITLKLATSLDGCIALSNGQSRWITGPQARAHGHLERARSNMILVGRGTFDADAPRLDVRLPGLEPLSPRRAVLSRAAPPDGWEGITSPEAVSALSGVDWLLVEGGAETAAAFLRASLVDRLLLYRAPILMGGGKACLGDLGLGALESAHGRWQLADRRMLGVDTLETYLRAS
jgi:diaminohydroxyphosphoribosylaminopyrimidine deaminase/5-amino-6-(5-phosphoribosylamino)uracil reductase